MRIISEFIEAKQKSYAIKMNKKFNIKTPLEEEKPKGKVFVVTDTGMIVPYQTLVDSVIRKPGSNRIRMSKAEKDIADSQQLEADDAWSFDHNLAPRPFEPADMLVLFDNTPYFSGTVGQIAVDVAGLGHSLVLREDGKENAEERKKAEAMLESPDGENTFHEVCKRWIIDWGLYGWSGLEIRRDLTSKVAKVNHVRSQTLWVHKDDNKYAQKVGMKATWFNKYGAKEDISRETGLAKDAKEGNIANEMIFYREYHPGHARYGIPKIYSSAGAVIGMIGARDFNLAFFNNYGVPTYFILLEGDWDDGAEKIVTDFLKNCKDPSNAHKTMVFKTPEGCKLTLIPVAVKREEGSFSVFHKIWKEEILTAYRMPEYRLGIVVIGSLGGHLATEMTEIYKQSIVEPNQMVLEHIWSNMIFRDGMGIENYKIKFKDMDTRDLDTEIERATDMISYGLATPNAMRERLELGEPYDSGNEYYMDSSLVPVRLAGTIIGEQTSKSAKLPKYVINLPEPQGVQIYKGNQKTFESEQNLKPIMGSVMALASGGKLYGFLTLNNIQPLHKSQEESKNFQYSFKFTKLPKPLPIKIKSNTGSIISDNYAIASGG